MSGYAPSLVAPFLLAWILVACADTGRATTGEPCRTCATMDHSAHLTRTAGIPAPATSVLGTLGTVIAAAPAFSRIVVPAGEYREPTIVIRKPVELIADPGAILDGAGTHTVLRIEADDVTVRGFTIRNTGAAQVEERAGIRVVGSKRCLIADNQFENTAFGVYLEKTTACTVRGNTLRGSGAGQSHNGNGIHAWSSDSVSVIGNTIQGHRDGVYFEFVQRGRITRNLSTKNARYGLHFMFSDDCEYDQNTYRENGNGVAVMYSKRVTMTNNTFAWNRGNAAYGLLLKDINESRILGNRFRMNSVGVHLEGANRNQVSGNEFVSNGIALRVLANAQDNVLESNDFVGNAFDVATNSRANYSTVRGNFWDRYRGYDLDRNGIGDVPHLPVTLFSLVVEQSPSSLVLLRSPFVGLLDLAERAFPSLTPSALRDASPRLHRLGA